MNTSTRLRLTRPSIAVTLVAAAIAFTATACAGVSNAPSAQPSTQPSASSTVAPTASPTTAPSLLPSASASASASEDPGSDLMPIKVDLANSGNHNVYIDIVDQSGNLVSGKSGQPGDGASIAGGVVEIKNVDADTLQLKWSDIVGDNALALYIDKSATHFVLVQPEHEGDTFPVDRILLLDFSQPVSASGIQAVLQNGTEPVG